MYFTVDKLVSLYRPISLHFTRGFSSKLKPVTHLDIKLKKKVNCAVYGCGLSASGALAIPRLVVNDSSVTAKEARKPTRIAHFNIRGIKHVSAGFGFSIFASNEKIYGAGLNNRSQVTSQRSPEGVGQEYYISAKRIALPTDGKILSVSSGRGHSLVATTNGVYAFGDNCHGQCGHDPEKRREVVGSISEPLPLIEVPSNSPVVRVHCTLDSSFLLTAAGEIFAFGLNEDGQCANGEFGIQWRPSKILGDAASVKISSLSGSSDTLLAVSTNGDVFVWGQCEYGQIGDNNRDIQLNVSRRLPFSMGRIVSATATSAACLAVDESGQVFVWGVGVLGMGPNNQRLTRPMLMDQPLFDSQKVTNVYAGCTSMAAVNEQGRLFVWGQNRFGLLGLGHDKDQYFPYQVYLPGDSILPGMTVERAAGLVVYRKVADTVQYLLLQASYPPYHWTPPKGHVDPGEDEWTAALRETEEEAGIKKEHLDIHEDCHQTLAYDVKKRGDPNVMVPKTVKYWLAGLRTADVVLSHEHQNSQWAGLEEAVKVAQYAEMESLFRKFDTYLQQKRQ